MLKMTKVHMVLPQNGEKIGLFLTLKVSKHVYYILWEVSQRYWISDWRQWLPHYCRFLVDRIIGHDTTLPGEDFVDKKENEEDLIPSISRTPR